MNGESNKSVTVTIKPDEYRASERELSHIIDECMGKLLSATGSMKDDTLEIEFGTPDCAKAFEEILKRYRKV